MIKTKQLWRINISICEVCIVKKSELSKIPVDSYPIVERHNKYDLYIATAKIKNLVTTNEEILIVTLHNIKNKKNKFRIFASKTEFATEMIDTNKWSEATIEKLLPTSWLNKEPYGWDYRIVNVLYADKESEQCGAKFFNRQEINTLEALKEFQGNIRRAELVEKHRKTRQKIDSLMAQIKPLPKDIDKWINNIPMLKSRYIFYKRKGKKMDGYCTSCKSNVQVKNAKHNEAGKCPICNSNIIFKAQGIAKNVIDESAMAIIQKGVGILEGAIIVRHFSICRDYCPEYKNPTTEYCEDYRYIVKNKTVYMYEYKTVYSVVLGSWEDANWQPVKNPTIPKSNYYLYTRNLHKALEDTQWQYCCIKEYAQYVGEFKVMNYIDTYLDFPSIEYLVKLKLFNILSEKLNRNYNMERAVNFQGKNIKDMLGVEKSDIPFVKKMNLSTGELYFYQKARKNKRTVTADDINWIRKSLDIADNLSEITFYTTPHKAIKYIDKQHNSNRLLRNELRDWLDYLTNASFLGFNIKSNRILFPKDLKKAHDEMSNLNKAKINGIYTEKIADMEAWLNEMYKFSTNNYLIRAPHSIDEIIEEGLQLDHCVSDYIERIANKKTAVLFIREKSNPNTPFYTMEIKDHVVVQVRGFDNCDAIPDVNKFVELWKVKKVQKLINALNSLRQYSIGA